MRAWHGSGLVGGSRGERGPWRERLAPAWSPLPWGWVMGEWFGVVFLEFLVGGAHVILAWVVVVCVPGHLGEVLVEGPVMPAMEM